MSSQEHLILPIYSISPTPSIEEVSWALQENSVSSSALSSNDINNKTSRANLQATDLIYGSSLESSDEDTSISSGNKGSIPSARNRKQWHIPNEVGLKASMLDLQILKLLPFATNEECKNTESQLYEKLLVLEAQFNQNNDNLGAAITVEKEKYDSLSAELWGLFAIPNSKAVAEDELT
ncbi:21101_t:CDS:2 [Dentiscutata erythropus]|uniref:21101_t:CDS:1 n=1 Tax=Dentiscutata erythropus TaxID=1348616 RepID=A0A9N9JBX8_9GLOM|nr:21101_t:CDS:2 [Dentiscutata erythropus]